MTVRSSPRALRRWTVLALAFAPALLGARGCAPESHELCPDDATPVCGADGVTYANRCDAERAGVELAHAGACETACYEIYSPVCGADGVTYPNDCYAERAGVSIARRGACECPPVACARHCEHGFVRDASGCAVCECAPPPVCPDVLCTLACEHGFEVDPATGCPTCSCRPAPTACRSDADCAEDETCALPPCLPFCDDADGDGACDNTCDPGVCVSQRGEPYCSTHADCGPGGVCEIVGCSGTRVECEGDGSERDCALPPDVACFGHCRAAPAPAECVSDADCGDGEVCDVSDCRDPGGDLDVCGGFCRPTTPAPFYCDADSDCGPGGRCEPIACAAVCLPQEGGGSDECVWDCPGGICVVDGSEPPSPPPSRAPRSGGV